MTGVLVRGLADGRVTRADESIVLYQQSTPTLPVRRSKLRTGWKVQDAASREWRSGADTNTAGTCSFDADASFPTGREPKASMDGGDCSYPIVSSRVSLAAPVCQPGRAGWFGGVGYPDGEGRLRRDRTHFAAGRGDRRREFRLPDLAPVAGKPERFRQTGKRGGRRRCRPGGSVDRQQEQFFRKRAQRPDRRLG